MATSMISVASTCTCGGISTFDESKISLGNVDTRPAMNDVTVTSFIAGSVSTFPREIFDSAKVEIPRQAHVLATLIMAVVIVILAVGTLVGERRRARLG